MVHKPKKYKPPNRAVLARGRRSSLAVLGFLVLAVMLVFGQTMRHDFVNYDDDVYVYENPSVTGGLTFEGITWAFTATHAGNWHPLTWFSHMLDCQLYGLDAGGHHLSNILVHAANAFLLFLVFRRMTGDVGPSFVAAVLFAIHPLRVESVAWVGERKDVLSGLCFMLTLGAYVGYARHPFSLVRYLSVVAMFALGLAAKPTLVTLPFVLLLLDYWPLGRMRLSAGAFSSPRRLIIEKIPLLAMTAASCVVTFLVQSHVVVALDIVPVFSRVANALVSYAAYIWQLFYPVKLAVLYPYSGVGLPTATVLSALQVLLGITVVVLLWRRRFPYLMVGWFWYLGMLVPMIGLVQVGAQAMADRYTYLSQIGLYVALSWAARDIVSSRSVHRVTFGAIFAMITLTLIVCAWRQTSYWHDSERLWIRTLACTKQNALAHYNLGVHRQRFGRTDEAVAQYHKALEIRPTYWEAHTNLGVILQERERIDEAVARYKEALKIKPDYAEAYCNLGSALIGRGQVDEAIAHLRKALQIKPDLVEARFNLGVAMYRRGQVAEAIIEYRRALAIKPDHTEAHNSLGFTLAGSGQVDEAISHLQTALQLDPDYAEAHNNLGSALAGRRQPNEAIAHFQKAVQIRPDYVTALCNLGSALIDCGRLAPAIGHLRQALAIKPDNAQAHYSLGVALHRQGKTAAALEHWREAIRLQPDKTAAVNQLAWILATCPNSTFRNGTEAVELAQRAVQLSGGKEPAMLDTLAAAYAEAGQFGEAVQVAERAATVAAGQGNTDLVKTVRTRIKRYQAGLPYHETGPESQN